MSETLKAAFVRHGHNTPEGHLSTEGMMQAYQATATIKELTQAWGDVALCTSSTPRAKETASIIAQAFRNIDAPIILHSLQEDRACYMKETDIPAFADFPHRHIVAVSHESNIGMLRMFFGDGFEAPRHGHGLMLEFDGSDWKNFGTCIAAQDITLR